MKRVLIIADTHMPKKKKEWPLPIIEVLEEGVDIIIHAGDWSEKSVYDELKQWAPVHGVRGNVDKDDWGEKLPEHLIITIEHLKIGVVHGHLGKGRTTPERALRSFKEESVDLIVFGHSHIPYLEKEEDVILFNPGSPTDKRRQKQFSYGLLTIQHNNEKLEHHYF
ncbi:metallophosphoesterase [Fictibacillus nanhaiensis]|uniref:metallophosphoesterase family protein n=1 Tax=Fictibacillus nanhaiensis TaxID=742169 RepID=UPI001C986C30|nr:metallophosphoesterase [Fictibacillus nanhaiensis]MBY6035928.1 metallophosphoesterase [Fictibacillus nanhaiensis]